MSEQVTFLDHPSDQPFWFSGQINSILQAQPGFPSPYSGPNSLRANPEVAVSAVITAFFAYAPFRTTEFIVNAESALGGGLSSALGLAGFTNLDVVRNPSLSKEPYLARLEIHQIIPLSPDWVINDERGPLTSLVRVPRHRLELRLGKMSTADFFDVNPAASDSHLQFMNWTVDNNGAYDYAADTRGYTYGLIVEYQGPRIAVRFGELLMPTVANGIDIDFDIANNRSENLEVELNYLSRPGWAGTLRVLGFVNHANMGNYRASIALAAGTGVGPDITATRRPGTIKYGFGLNLVQQLWSVVRVFARGGWNDGRNETFAYTEVDNTFEVGGDLCGVMWRRPEDRIGLAFVTNGISDAHRDYLKAGGLGFLLGDGTLRYGRETILEAYYNAHVWKGIFLGADYQFVANPGYNQDRGPVSVFSARAHVEF